MPEWLREKIAAVLIVVMVLGFIISCFLQKHNAENISIVFFVISTAVSLVVLTIIMIFLPPAKIPPLPPHREYREKEQKRKKDLLKQRVLDYIAGGVSEDFIIDTIMQFLKVDEKQAQAYYDELFRKEVPHHLTHFERWRSERLLAMKESEEQTKP